MAFPTWFCSPKKAIARPWSSTVVFPSASCLKAHGSVGIPEARGAFESLGVLLARRSQFGRVSRPMSPEFGGGEADVFCTRHLTCRLVMFEESVAKERNNERTNDRKKIEKLKLTKEIQ